MKWLFLICLTISGTGISLAQKLSDDKYLEKVIELLDQNQDDEALRLLDKWLSQRVENKDALFLRAGILNNKGEFLGTLTDYNKVIALDPENKEAHYNRGIIKYQLGQYQSAIEDFLHCMKLPQNETNTAYFRMDPGTNAATGISTLGTMETEIWNYTGLCHYQMTEYALAIEAYDRGLQIEKGNADLLTNRALAHEKIGNLDQAKSDYQSVLKYNPDHEWATLNYQRLSSTEIELSDLDEFIVKFPDQPIGYANRGLVFFNQEAFLSAESDFKKAHELMPDNAEYALNLALVKIKLGKLNEAETILLDLSNKDPQNPGILFNLGNIRYKLSQYQEAISYYTLAIAIEDKSAAFLYNRALAYYENNQVEEACMDIERAQAIEPGIGAEFQDKFCIFEE